MKRLALISIVMLLPSAAIASDPTPLYFFMGLQLLSWLWPFLLPLPFLWGATRKTPLYLMLLLLPLGLLEVADLPVQIGYGIAAWGVYDVPKWLIPYSVTGRHLFAIVLSLLLLPRLRRLVRDAIAAADREPGDDVASNSRARQARV